MLNSSGRTGRVFFNQMNKMLNLRVQAHFFTRDRLVTRCNHCLHFNQFGMYTCRSTRKTARHLSGWVGGGSMLFGLSVYIIYDVSPTLTEKLAFVHIR